MNCGDIPYIVLKNRPTIYGSYLQFRFLKSLPISQIPCKKIKGPDNPTSQLLPKMSFNGFSGDREGKTKEVVKDREGTMVGMNVFMYVCMYVKW